MPNTHTLISSQVLPADGTSSITFSGIPQNYNDLVFKISVRGASTNYDTLRISPNNSTTTTDFSYFATWYNGNAGKGYSRADNQLMIVDMTGSGANNWTNYDMYFSDYSSSRSVKNFTISGIEDYFGSYSNGYIEYYHGRYKSTSAITSVVFTAIAGGSSSFKAYSSIELYGIKNS